MAKNTEFKSTIAEIIDLPKDSLNPFLTKIKFIFADNQGNSNNQGIEEEDFDTIAQSSINMPIKINYAGGSIGSHAMSVPIGHITDMTKTVEGDNPKLIGEAVLYREEYPEEVQFLKDAKANDEAPGISWEIAYSDSVLKNGVEWLKQAVTMAATFVGRPAYGKRTQLLAIAQEHINDEDFMTELKKVISEWESKEGGSTTVGEENELTKAQAALTEALAKVADLEETLTQKDEEITTLTDENSALKEENAEFKNKATISERTAALAEAGIKFELEGDALAAKQALWLSMSQEVFDAYLADLSAAAKAAPKKGEASERDGLPKFTTGVAGEGTISLEDLKAIGRKASRGDLVVE